MLAKWSCDHTSESKRRGKNGHSSESRFQACCKGAIPSAFEAVVIVDSATRVFNTGTAGASVKLLLVALECVVNIGTAHVGAEPGALGVTSCRAEILGAGKDACNQQSDWDQNSVQHSFFFINLFILIIIVFIIIHYKIIRSNQRRRSANKKGCAHKDTQSHETI